MPSASENEKRGFSSSDFRSIDALQNAKRTNSVVVVERPKNNECTKGKNIIFFGCKNNGMATSSAETYFFCSVSLHFSFVLSAKHKRNDVSPLAVTFCGSAVFSFVYLMLMRYLYSLQISRNTSKLNTRRRRRRRRQRQSIPFNFLHFSYFSGRRYRGEWHCHASLAFTHTHLTLIIYEDCTHQYQHHNRFHQFT